MKKWTDKRERYYMRCESCGKDNPTQVNEQYSLCDHCWASKFSKTSGVPFRTVLKESLEKMGMMRKEGETIEQWSNRCRKRTPLNESVEKLHDNMEAL